MTSFADAMKLADKAMAEVHPVGIRGRKIRSFLFTRIALKRHIKQFDKGFSHAEKLFAKLKEEIPAHELEKAQKGILEMDELIADQFSNYYYISDQLNLLLKRSVLHLQDFTKKHKIPPDVVHKFFGKAVATFREDLDKEFKDYNALYSVGMSTKEGKSSLPVSQAIRQFAFSENTFLEYWALWRKARQALHDEMQAEKLEGGNAFEDQLKKIASALEDEYQVQRQLIERANIHMIRVLHLATELVNMLQKEFEAHEIPAEFFHQEQNLRIKWGEIAIKQASALRSEVVQLRNYLGGNLS